MTLREMLTLIGIFVVSNLTIGIVAPGLSFFLVDFNDAIEGSSAASIGFTQSLLLGAVSAFCPLAATVSRRIGDKITIIIGCAMVAGGMMMTSQVTSLWQLFLTHSLITGIGTSLPISCIIFIIGNHFEGSQIYFGFLYAGSASGMLFTPILCAEAKIYFGFRGAILFLGAISMNSIPISMLIFKKYTNKHCEISKTQPKTETKDLELSRMNYENDEATTLDLQLKECENTVDKENSSLPHHFLGWVSIFRKFNRNPILIMMAVIRALTEYAYIGFFIHFTASLIYKGIPERRAAFALSSFGLGSLLGRLTAFVPNHVNLMQKSTSFILSMLILSALSIAFDYLTNIYIIVLITMFVGYFVGWYVILFPSVCRDLISEAQFKDVYGIIIIPGGISCMITGYTVGLIYDASGLYKLSFFIAGGMFALNGLLMTAVKSKLKQNQHDEAKTISTNLN